MLAQVTLVVDGGCHNNQDASKRVAYGSVAVLYKGKVEKIERFEFGSSTSNEAEYKAFIAGLEYAQGVVSKNPHVQFEWIIRTDSQLVATQVRGVAKCKAPHLKPLCERATAALRTLGARLEQVGREEIAPVLGH
jgi:ribonuclease HI